MSKLDLKANSLYEKYKAYSMIPKYYYKTNIKVALLHKNIPGTVVECGTWKGGMIAGIAELLGPERHYHLFDSYEGLPPAKDNDGESARKWQADVDGETYFDNCTAALEDAKSAMSLTGCDKVTYHKGWFQDTVPSFKCKEGIAILRLDGDWYDSTMVCLKHLYPQVNDGGVIIFDDYYTWEGCARALHDYLSETKSTDRIFTDGGLCRIFKGEDYSTINHIDIEV